MPELRIQLQKELDEKLEDEVELTRGEEEKIEEEEARTRMTFDPLNKVFDARKRRVTDLAECSRVTLPKPLPTKEEAIIEMQRNVLTKVYEDYRKRDALIMVNSKPTSQNARQKE